MEPFPKDALVTAAAVDFVHLDQVTGRDGCMGANAVAVGFRTTELDLKTKLARRSFPMITSRGVARILRRLIELLEQLAVPLLLGNQLHSLLDGLRGARSIIVFQAGERQQVIVAAVRFQLDRSTRQRQRFD